MTNMFWGLTIEPGKHYTQTVEESFHVSMAAIETRDHVAESGGERTGVVQVLIKHEKTEFLVCSLFYGTIFQQPLDLNFTEGEEVTFFTEGRGIVHLTGYLVKEEALDIDQDMMSLEDASSSDDVSVSSEGMASGEESARQEVKNRPRKRKKKRTRWKITDPDRRRRPRYRQKRRKLEGAERINPQRLPRSGEVKQDGKRENFHKRGWTTTVVGSVRSRTSIIDTNTGSELCDEHLGEKVSDVVLSTSVSSIPSKANEDVKRTLEKGLPSIESLDSSQGEQDTRRSTDGSPLRKQGELGAVLQETLARLSPTVSKMPVRTSDSPVQVQAGSSLSSLSVRTPESVHSPCAKDVQMSPSSSSQNVTVHKQSISNNKQPATSNQARTKEREVSQQRPSPAERLRPPSQDSSRQDTPGMVVKDEDDDEVLIEEIKIEDDSSEGEQQSFSMATHLPLAIASSSATTTGQTLPRITSVTSIRNQQLMGNQLVAMPPQFQEPAAWNIPGPSRGQHGVSLPHRANMADPFMAPPQDRLAPQPMPVALSRHADPMAGVEMGDLEGSNEEGEMILPEEILRAMPVATEMGDLTAMDLEVNGVDISQEQILLARGFNVFLSRGQLYDVQMASKETSKTPWSVCVRRLMDIYFDRQTLAMGKATSHGFSNNPDRKALNQEVIQAIKAYIQSNYAFLRGTDVNHAMTAYCRDSRRMPKKGYQSSVPAANH